MSEKPLLNGVSSARGGGGDDVRVAAHRNMFIGSDSSKYASKGVFGDTNASAENNNTYSSSNQNRRRPNVPVSALLAGESGKTSQNTRLKARLDRLGNNTKSTSSLLGEEETERNAVQQQSNRADSLLQGAMSDMDKIINKSHIYSMSDYYTDGTHTSNLPSSSRSSVTSSVYQQPSKKNLGGMPAVLSQLNSNNSNNHYDEQHSNGGGVSSTQQEDILSPSGYNKRISNNNNTANNKLYANMSSTSNTKDINMSIPSTMIPSPPTYNTNITNQPTSRRRPISSRTYMSNTATNNPSYNILQDLTNLENKIKNDEEDLYISAKVNTSSNNNNSTNHTSVDYFQLLTDKVDASDFVYKHKPTTTGSNLDADLITSMSQRLQVLEKLVKQQTTKLNESNAIAFEHSQKETRMTRVLALQQRQILEMERFLSDYDMKWAGYQVQHDQHDITHYIEHGVTSDTPMKVASNTKNPTSNTLLLEKNTTPTKKTTFISQSPISSSTLKQWVASVNERVPSNVMSTVDHKASLQKPQLPLLHFKNGISFDRLFLLENSVIWTRVMTDLSEGFMPDQLREKYPDGVNLKYIDKLDYLIDPSTHAAEDLIDNKDMFELKRSAVVTDTNQKVVDGAIVRNSTASSHSKSSHNNSSNHNNSNNIHQLSDNNSNIVDDASSTNTKNNTNTNNNLNSIEQHILSFSSIGRVLESSKPVLPSVDVSKLSKNIVAMGLQHKVTSQMDNNVRKMLGLGMKKTNANVQITKTMVSDGDVISVTKPKVVENPMEPLKSTNIAEKSRLLLQNYTPSPDAVSVKDQISKYIPENHHPKSNVDTQQVTTMDTRKTTNVAQSRLLTSASTSKSSNNVNNSSNTNKNGSPATKHSMFQYDNSGGGVGKPLTSTDLVHLTNTSHSKQTVFDANTNGTYTVELEQILRINNNLKELICYIKLHYTDQPTVTNISTQTNSNNNNNSNTSYFIRIDKASSMSQLHHIIKTHRRSLGYEPGLLEIRQPHAKTSISEIGTIETNKLHGQQLIIRRKL